MSDAVGPGSLKLVAAASPERALSDIVERELASRAGADGMRRLPGDAFIVYTDASAAEVRDWLTPRLREGATLFVVEFERWSAYGAAVDQPWLLQRGH